jgi:Tfp pilus assembly protein PilF
VKLDPKNARIYGNRGMVKLRQGKNEDAQSDFKKAIELEPKLKEKLDPLINEQKAPAAQREKKP